MSLSVQLEAVLLVLQAVYIVGYNMTLNEKEQLCEKLDKNLDKMKYNCKSKNKYNI